MIKPAKLDWIDKHSKTLFYSVMAGSGLLYVALDPQYRTGYLNDDALYVIRAREFANNFPFRSLLVRPDYPLPGLPLLLTPLVKLAGPHWTSLERLSIGVTLLSVFLLWKWTNRWLSKGESLAVTALFALNPVVARFSGIIMPEPYYALAAIASFVLLSQLLETPNWKTALGLGFVVGWGSLLRPEAVLILISLLPALLLHRHGRSFLRVAIIPILLWLSVFLLMAHSRANLQTEYGGDVAALKNYWLHSPLVGMGFAGQLLRLFLINTMTALKLPLTPGWIFVIAVMILFHLGAMGVGFSHLWKEHPSQRSLYLGMGLFCGLYFAVHVFWHVSARRYAIPLLPFMLIFLVHGVHALWSPLKKKEMWTGLAFSLLLIPSLYKNGLAVHEALVAPDPMKSPPWRSLTWLNQNTPSDVQVLSDIATNVELYTDRQAVVEVSAASSEMLLYRLIQDHLEYIVYRQLSFVSPGVSGADDPNLVWNQMAEWFTHHADRFPLVFSDAAEQTGVFHVVAEPGFTEAFEKTKEATQDYQAGRLDDALQLAQQSIAIDPKVGEAFNLLGAIYLRQNDLLHAEHAWLKATQLLPDSPNAMVNLATLYQMKGQPERVSDYLRRAKDIADRNGLQVIFQSNMDDLHRQWGNHKARLFIDPLNFTLHHSPTVGHGIK